MKKLQNLILPTLVIAIITLIYFFYFAPTDKLGDFSKFGGSEINQTVVVEIVESEDFGRDMEGKIIAFMAKDKNGRIVNVNLHDPAPAEIESAEIVELLGHIHGKNFGAAEVKIIR